MWPRVILNRSEPRNSMVYVSCDFYLINLVFKCIFIISHHSHMCPSDHHSSQSSHYTKAWPWRVGPFSTLHDQHKNLNLAEERPFLSACWYFDNVFLLGHSGNKLIPSSPTHFCYSIWETLHKIIQCLVNYCQFASVVMTGDTAWK